jgi:hypothetical protein
MGVLFSNKSESRLLFVATKLIPFSPPLPDEWSEANSMGTLRKEFSKVPKKQKSTLGRLDANDRDTTSIQQSIIHTYFAPLRSYRVRWKQSNPASFDWDGLYVLKKSQGYKVRRSDPDGRTPFEQCWDCVADPSTSPPSVFPGDVLSRLPVIVRSELENLPEDLSLWNELTSAPYCAGIGGRCSILPTANGD